jgi:hypothetical protein
MPGPRRETSAETSAKFLTMREAREKRQADREAKRRWFEHQLDLPIDLTGAPGE